jgi:D-amino-acid dehydrogenase
MADVVVLGAGAVGVSTAYYLQKAGFSVAVVERQPAAAMETSWGNGGVIHASEVEPWSQPGMPRNILRWLGHEEAPLLLRPSALPHMWNWGLRFILNCTEARFQRHCKSNLALALHSLRSLREIRQELGLAYDASTMGVMKIYRSATAFDKAERSLRRLEGAGLVLRRLSPVEAVAIEPALRDAAAELHGAFHFPNDEVGDCNKFTQGLEAECAKRGVQFHYETTVRSIEVTAGRVAAVQADKARLAASRIVVALGSYTPALLSIVGLRAPIYPVKGLSITFPRGAWREAPAMPVIDDSHLFGLVPIGDRLRISGSAEIAGFDTQPGKSRCQAIVTNASKTFPSLRNSFNETEAVYWAGLRPVTPAGTPLIGPTLIKGLWVNAGHGHLGWTLACGSGRVVADLMAGRDPGIALPEPQGCVLPQ